MQMRPSSREMPTEIYLRRARGFGRENMCYLLFDLRVERGESGVCGEREAGEG